jgi:tetratricopeptide (TPR) repeat protein
MRHRIALCLCVLLVACAGAPPAPPAEGLLRDHLFAPPSERIRADDVFAVSPEMRRFLSNDIAPQLRQQGLQRGLVQALYKPDQIRLEYDAAVTRNAAQAFEARTGNCLSLVIMTAALAHELGLTVRYQSAFVDETWSRSGELYFRSGHVNITLGRRFMDAGSGRVPTEFTVDFLPAGELRGLRTREIDETTVLAMYLNNRAAEALANGPKGDAYWWAREAVRRAPAFLSAYNTLGVIYLRAGELDAAEQAFAHVIARDAVNAQALFNLSQLLAKQGRTVEAAALAARLARAEPNPPFHYFDLGRAAMERGDFAAARGFFLKEIAREPNHPDFHHWLALAEFRIGDLDAASRHLAHARDLSTRPRDQQLYAGKLAWVRAMRPE